MFINTEDLILRGPPITSCLKYKTIYFCFGCAGCTLLPGVFSSCSEGSYSLVAWASHCGGCSLGHPGFRSCGSWAPEHRLYSCGAQALVAPWHVGSSRIRIKLVSSAFQCGLSTTGCPGKSSILFKNENLNPTKSNI